MTGVSETESSGAGLTEPRFRRAVAGDVPALVELVESAYRGESSRHGWTTEADLLEGRRTGADEIGAFVNSGTSRMIVAEEAGLPVACCLLDAGQDAAYFGMFAVGPGLQGRGLGARLLAEAERVAREEFGAERMRMTVIAQRDDLIAWYERRGYCRTGVTTAFPYGDERFGVPRRADLYFEELCRELG